MKLKEWCKKNETSVNQVSKAIGFSRQAISLWILKKRDISVITAEAIRIFTKGKVTFTDWL